RSQQQGRSAVQAYRPIADGADQDAGDPGHQAEFVEGGYAFAVPVGNLPAAIAAEGPVEQSLDLRPISRAFKMN
ncbi:MAG: hypothetical protein ACJ8H8_13445, partial [Geminicoccaceae bacterium]